MAKALHLALPVLLAASSALAEDVVPTYARLLDPVRRERQAEEDRKFQAWERAAQQAQGSICANGCRERPSRPVGQPANPFAQLPDWAAASLDPAESVETTGTVRTSLAPLLVLDRAKRSIRIVFTEVE